MFINQSLSFYDIINITLPLFFNMKHNYWLNLMMINDHNNLFIKLFYTFFSQNLSFFVIFRGGSKPSILGPPLMGVECFYQGGGGVLHRLFQKWHVFGPQKTQTSAIGPRNAKKRVTFWIRDPKMTKTHFFTFWQIYPKVLGKLLGLGPKISRKKTRLRA